MATTHTGNRPFLKNSPFNAAREAAEAKFVPIPVGEQVLHERHGLGKVVALDGPRAVIVDFGGGNRRRVQLDSAKLEVL
ncbi:hypothetical protein [Georgenia sp. SYP-B2076]|uniref:hypothetical protein n=1 Tax=Georgenia sp. SYP-B2076 TaxID=2495881 RepID=UPI000F8D17E6|nr:hypothetical protein [Georgenia sp. SYP-B2076]